MEKQLTLKEIIELTHEYKKLAEWEQVRQRAYELAGEQVHKVQVVFDDHGDIPGNGYPFIYYVILFDKEGVILRHSGIIQPCHDYDDQSGLKQFPKEILQSLAIPMIETSFTEVDLMIPDEIYEQEDEPFTSYDMAEDHQEDDYPSSSYDMAEEDRQSPSPLFNEASGLEDDDDMLLYERMVEDDRPCADPPQEPQPDEMPGIYLRISPNDDTHTLFPPKNATYILDQPLTLSPSPLYLKEGDYHHNLSDKEFLMLADMHQKACEWERVHTLVRATFGPKAHKAVIETYEVYDDDGGYYSLPTINNLYWPSAGVSDRDGNMLEPDLNLPIWQGEYASGILKSSHSYEVKRTVDSCRGVLDEMLCQDDLYSALTCELDMSPPRPPAIYVASDQEVPIKISDMDIIALLREKYGLVDAYPVYDRDGNVKELWLDHLKLTAIPHEIGQLQQMKGLNLSHNQLAAIPATICQLPQLEWLDLSHNQFTQLPPEIGLFPQLVALHLSHNQLTSLPSEIGQLSRLVLLALAHNRLTELPSTIGKLFRTKREEWRWHRPIHQMYLSHNALTHLPPEIGAMHFLHDLELHNNQLIGLPAKMMRLEHLKRLRLDGNQFKRFPLVLCRLKLEALDLSYNQLTTLPPQIGNMTNLRHLYLSHNQLTEIPREIVKIEPIETRGGYQLVFNALYLDNNQLTRLPPELATIMWGMELNLRNNQVVELPPEIYEAMHHSVHFKKCHLDGNPVVELLPDKELWTGQDLYEARGTYGWKQIWGLFNW